MFSYLPFCASYPYEASFLASILFATTLPYTPALLAIYRAGKPIARFTMLTPVRISDGRRRSFAMVYRRSEAISSAVPPPAKIPYETAARVAFNASIIRSFFSLIYTYDAPPTLITATPPDNFAKRSTKRYRLNSWSSEAIMSLIIWTRYSIAIALPPPYIKIHSSRETVTLLQLPR